ncbi:hypothetical protein [uncultured Methanoregula sp.]|uniref:hypothetical protein n=1 Tax=uncultured Methanoregula sp. TaxID=1005933 RepID=UPI002AAAD7C1|nr:hypothetical protein [uncultured Methanoregula sp.]
MGWDDAFSSIGDAIGSAASAAASAVGSAAAAASDAIGSAIGGGGGGGGNSSPSSSGPSSAGPDYSGGGGGGGSSSPSDSGPSGSDGNAGPSGGGASGDTDSNGNELTADVGSIKTNWWDYPAHSPEAQIAWQNSQDLVAVVAASAKYHADARDSGLPTQLNPYEIAGDQAALLLAQGYGVTGKSLQNLQDNVNATSVFNSLDPLINPLLMNQSEYIRQVTNNPTAYGSQQAYVANAYFGTGGIATTIDQAINGIAKGLGISQDAAAAFAGISSPSASSTSPTTPTSPVIDTTGITRTTTTGGGGGSGGSSSSTTGNTWLSALAAIAVPLLLVGVIGYLIYAFVTGSKHGHRSVA